MAGDGKILRTGTTSASSTLSTTSRRTTGRYASSRSTTRSFNIEPAPVVLEIGSTVVRAGYAEQCQPQHLIAIETPIFDEEEDKASTKSKTKTEFQWYLTLVPVIEQVYDRLMCRPSTRRVVCICKPYAPVAFQRALEQHLWNLNVPAVVHLDCLQVVPIAQGWKRGLVVHVTREEAICACYADGFVLPYTYQMVPAGYKYLLDQEKDEHTGRMHYILPSSKEDMDAKLNKLLDVRDAGSLVVAILMCLQACPRDLAAQVASHIVFCGDAIALLPDLPRRVTKKVEDMLEGENGSSDDDKAVDSPGAFSSSNGPVFGMVPIDMKRLQPLAARLTLRSCTPYRADFVSWIGASLFAATWNKYDDDETPIPWIFPPSSEPGTGDEAPGAGAGASPTSS